MGRLLVVVWSSVLLAQTDVRNPRSSPSDIDAGARTFRSHCAPCHGLNAEGGRGPNLATGNFYHGSSDAELLRNISNGIPQTEMPGLFYEEDRIWQIVAYIRSLSNNPSTNAPGDPAQGERLLRAKGCAQCHRVNGEGGRLGPDLTNIGRTRSPAHLRESLVDPNADVRQRYWVVNLVSDDGKRYTGFLMNEDTYTVQFIDIEEQLHSFSKPGLREYTVEKISKMPSYKGAFTEEELRHLVAYLSSLRPKGGVQ